MRKAALGFVLLVFAVPVAAQEGYGFYGTGVAGNFDEGMVEVGQEVIPQLTLEWGYPIGGPVSAGFELSGAFYLGHTTQRWGRETFGFGAVLGGLVAVDVADRWFVTGGGGWILSNPLSDRASGGFMEGHEDESAYQIVRNPVQPAYIRATVGYRLSYRWAIQAGVRTVFRADDTNVAPYAAIGFTP